MSKKSFRISPSLKAICDKPAAKSAFFALATALFFLVVCLGVNETLKSAAVVLIVLTLAALPFCFKTLRDRIHWPLILLFGFVLISGISTLYADVPQYALTEFLKLLLAFCLVLLLLGFARGEGIAPERRFASILEAASALMSLFSIDMISTRILSGLFRSVMLLFTQEYEALDTITNGSRLTSIFGNPNLFAGVAGIGVLLSLSLVLSTANRKERCAHLFCLSLNSTAFLLAFSRGGIVAIAIAFVFYLFLEHKDRRFSALLLMLETLALTLASVAVISTTSTTEWTGAQPLPLLCILFGGAALCLVDLLIRRDWAQRIVLKARVLVISITAVAVASACFIGLVIRTTGPATFQPDGVMSRAVYLTPGEYTAQVKTDADLIIMVRSLSREDSMMGTYSNLYNAHDRSFSFTVPEDSVIVYFDMHSKTGQYVESITYTGPESGNVPLDYKLLPSFIEDRIQGLTTSQTAIQRFVFFEDGFKLFLKNPILGSGLGAFENSIRSVQSFYYETIYAHNHYIQTLAETGIIGFLLFIGVLISSAAVIFFARRKDGFSPLLPSLGAALIFIAGHAAIEFVLSFYCYIPFAFAIFALINLSCGDALPSIKSAARTAILGVMIVSIAAYGLLLGMHMQTQSRMSKSPSFDTALEAVNSDPFEWQTYAMSVVMGSLTVDDAALRIKADELALRLGKVNTFNIPIYLAEYYFATDRTDAAYTMVERFVAFSASDSGTWNTAFDLLEFYYRDTDDYLAFISQLYDQMQEWDEANIGTIRLEQTSTDFLTRIGVIGGAQ